MSTRNGASSAPREADDEERHADIVGAVDIALVRSAGGEVGRRRCRRRVEVVAAMVGKQAQWQTMDAEHFQPCPERRGCAVSPRDVE